MHAQTRCRSVHARGFTAGQNNCGKSGATGPPGLLLSHQHPAKLLQLLMMGRNTFFLTVNENSIRLDSLTCPTHCLQSNVSDAKRPNASLFIFHGTTGCHEGIRGKYSCCFKFSPESVRCFSATTSGSRRKKQWLEHCSTNLDS